MLALAFHLNISSRSARSPGGWTLPASQGTGRPLEDRGQAGPSSANTSLVLTQEAERWGADPRRAWHSSEDSADAPRGGFYRHVAIATHVEPRHRVGGKSTGSCTGTPPFSTSASGKKPTQHTLAWPRRPPAL